MRKIVDSAPRDLLGAVRDFTDSLQHLRHLLEDYINDDPLPLMKNALKTDNVEALSIARKWIKTVDGQWFFDETYDPEWLKQEYSEEAYRKAESQLQKTRDCQDALLSITGKTDIERPSKYYGVIQLDGDSMGQWLSGDNAPPFRNGLHPDVIPELLDHEHWREAVKESSGLQRPQAPSQHLAISRALSNYALQLVPHIVEQHLGKLVYAGGDDVFAFVSFKHALPLARALRAAFSGYLNEQGAVDWLQEKGFVTSPGRPDSLLLTMGRTATASAGIVFAHYHQSLQQVRSVLRETEEYAKQEEGKDAFSVTTMKRSGEHACERAKWRYGPFDTIEVLRAFSDLIQSNLVSTGYVMDLKQEMEGLDALPKDAAILEAKRLYDRHAPLKRDDEKNNTLKKDGWERIRTLLEHCTSQQVGRLLEIAQFIGKGGAR
jgi:CRISPR-associated protein Cmr2